MKRASFDIVLRRGAADSVRRGHPWIFREAVRNMPANAAPGDQAVVRSEEGALIGHAIVDPKSPIVARVWTLGSREIDHALFSERIAVATALRAKLFSTDATTAYRLLNGEGDRAPGFVVDRYAHVAVLRVDGEAALARRDEFAASLWPVLQNIGVMSLAFRGRSDGKSGGELEALFGDKPPATIEVREHGVPFRVDLEKGQKTGAFLDQRENRRRVRALSKGERVLNLFSYAGGFSMSAALGGATHVTSVDVAAAAHATAQASFKLAGLDPSAHSFAAADAFAFLTKAKARGEKWGLIISDPPSFAPNEKSRERALSAYRSLHRACVAVLEPGGIFCASSCSSHVNAEDFLSTLDDEALQSSSLRLTEMHGQPADHPTLPNWPEGRYLKFAVLR